MKKPKYLYYVLNHQIIQVQFAGMSAYQSVAVYTKRQKGDKVRYTYYYTKKEYLFTSLTDANRYLNLKAKQEKLFEEYYNHTPRIGNPKNLLKIEEELCQKSKLKFKK